ncbi:MAG: glutamine synthetase [Candidatus Heimdallarchaeota archaeon]|nr:glutamine synthetase [Candidatus Heimdallarchaeota archaeon]
MKAMIDFENYFKENGIEFIQYQFSTIFGELKSVEFPVDIWEEMRNGSGVDGSSLGFLKTEQSDMKIIPDFDTLAILPWEPRVARFICDIYGNDGKPHPTDPRSILKRVIEQAKKLGYEYKTRPELEWFFLDLEFDPIDYGQYMDTLPFDMMGSLRRDIAADMKKMGIPIKTIHHECGAGQQEIEFLVLDALKQADNVQTAKMIIKAESAFEEIIGTFMPKPFPDQAGNGFHIHQYLVRDGKNIFSDKEKGISVELKYFVGGILEHVDAMTAILNPTTNSYKRLVPGHEAPVFKSWGIANRTALIRIPGYEKNARLEYRATDSATNIYLATALLLAAGLDGIKRKVEPISSTTRNIEDLSSQEREEMGITKLPENLSEALDFLEESTFIKEVLNDEILEIFLNKKRKEYKDYLDAKNKGEEQERDWEYQTYLERA